MHYMSIEMLERWVIRSLKKGKTKIYFATTRDTVGQIPVNDWKELKIRIIGDLTDGTIQIPIGDENLRPGTTYNIKNERKDTCRITVPKPRVEPSVEAIAVHDAQRMETDESKFDMMAKLQESLMKTVQILERTVTVASAVPTLAQKGTESQSAMMEKFTVLLNQQSELQEKMEKQQGLGEAVKGGFMLMGRIADRLITKNMPESSIKTEIDRGMALNRVISSHGIQPEEMQLFIGELEKRGLTLKDVWTDLVRPETDESIEE